MMTIFYCELNTAWSFILYIFLNDQFHSTTCKVSIDPIFQMRKQVQRWNYLPKLMEPGLKARFPSESTVYFFHWAFCLYLLIGILRSSEHLLYPFSHLIPCLWDRYTYSLRGNWGAGKLRTCLGTLKLKVV